jgi:nitrogen fixation protein FixH
MNISKLTHAGNVLLIGFGALIAMMSVLVYLSVRQPILMVSKDYYEQELQYQDKLNAMNNTSAFSPGFSAVPVKAGFVLLTVPESLGAHITQGTAYFYCPFDDKLDRSMKLLPSDNGQYMLGPLAEGKRYMLKLSFTSGDKQYYKEINIEP